MAYLLFYMRILYFFFVGIEDLKSKKVATDELDSYESLVRDAGY